jgi:hypothetical protein
MRKQSNAKYATFCGLAMLVTLGFITLQRGFAQDSNACNNRLIKGTYGFTIEGQKLGGAGPVGLQVGVAMATYDGVGGFTQIDTVTVDGTVVADFTHTRATGTYTVNPDCTGTFTIDFTDGRPPVAANFVISTDGSEIDTVVISAGGQQGILATRSIGKRRFPVFPVRLAPAQRTR